MIPSADVQMATRDDLRRFRYAAASINIFGLLLSVATLGLSKLGSQPMHQIDQIRLDPRCGLLAFWANLVHNHLDYRRFRRQGMSGALTSKHSTCAPRRGLQR